MCVFIREGSDYGVREVQLKDSIIKEYRGLNGKKRSGQKEQLNDGVDKCAVEK